MFAFICSMFLICYTLRATQFNQFRIGTGKLFRKQLSDDPP